MIGRLLDFWRPREAPLPPFPPQPPAAKDWGEGDVAKCIASRGDWSVYPSRLNISGPKPGEILRVADVVAQHDTLWLAFSQYDFGYYSAGHFRKLRPCSTEFREQLERRAPTPVPVALPEPVS